jgi:hypothetical protein
MSATLKASPIEAAAVRLAEIAHQWRLDRQQIEDWMRHESEREWRRRQCESSEQSNDQTQNLW